MSNERGFGKGIIRLEGSALARPPETFTNKLSPAAIELVTGIRVLSSSVMMGANSPFNRESLTVQTSCDPKPDAVLKNYTDDWWGE